MTPEQWMQVFGAVADRVNKLGDEASPAAVMTWTLAALRDEILKANS